MFDSQLLGRVICGNYIDYNLILLTFKGDILIHFDPPSNMSPHVPIVVTPPPLMRGRP